MMTTHSPTQTLVESVAPQWGQVLIAAGCPQCHQVHLVNETRVGMRCPACARGQLEPQPTRMRPEPPERIIPFQHTRTTVQLSLDKFVRQVWLRPDDFATDKLLQRIETVFVPMWLVDGDVVGTWEAEVGFDYQVQSSQESYNSSGEWVSREVLETRVRWEPRAGLIARHYDNLAVVALTTHNDLLHLVGNYDHSQAVAYDHALLGTAVVRVPDVEPDVAWAEAQLHFAKAAGLECKQASSANYIRSFSIRADYETLVWSLLLLPLFVTSYADDEGLLHPIFIHGVTGKVGGKRFASQRKGWRWAWIQVGIALLLGIVGAGLLLLQQYVRGSAYVDTLGMIGSICVVLAALLVVGAVVVVLVPWMWNSEQRGHKVVRG